MGIMIATTGGAGDCFGSTVAIAADIDATTSDVGKFSSTASAVLSSESLSSLSTSAVIETMPPSAIGGTAFVLPNNAVSDDTHTAVDPAARKEDGATISEETVLQSAIAPIVSESTSPIPTESKNNDMDITTEIKVQVQDELPAVTTREVTSEQQPSVEKMISKDNDNNDKDVDINSLSVRSKFGYSKTSAPVSEAMEDISLLVVPAAIVTTLALLAAPSPSIQEDAGNGEDDVVDITTGTKSEGNIKNIIVPDTTLKGTDTIIDGRNADVGRRTEWKLNSPIPYGLQEGTPKWSSLPPPPPPPQPKKKQFASAAPLFVSPSSTPTLVQEQPKATIIDSEPPFRGNTASFGTRPVTLNDSSSSPSSQAIKQPLKGTFSMGNSPKSSSSSSSSSSIQMQQKKGTPITSATTTTTDVPTSIPKSFAKSAYKKASFNNKGPQPLSPSVAAVSSGGGNAMAASNTMKSGMNMVKWGGSNPVAGWSDNTAKGTSTVGTASAPHPPLTTTSVGGEQSIANPLKGSMPAPANNVSNIQKTATSSSDRSGTIAPATYDTRVPKSYAKSSYKMSSTKRKTEQSMQPKQTPAPDTTFTAEPISGGVIRNEGMDGNGIIAGGMLKGQRRVGDSSLKSYSKSSFKRGTASSGIPGGGYLTDLSDDPVSLSGSISSIARGPLVTVSKGTENKSVVGDVGGVSDRGSDGNRIMKGTDGASSDVKETISTPLIRKGPTVRFGGGRGAGSFNKGNLSLIDAPTSTSTAESTIRETEFLSDLVQAVVPSTISPELTDILPSQVASVIPPTSPTSPSAIDASQSLPLQQVPTTTVRIGSATRFGSLAAFGNNSRGNADQLGLNTVQRNARVDGEASASAGTRRTGQQRPQSVTITDPRTGKQRTISASIDVNAPE
jgi:hypothetical protein